MLIQLNDSSNQYLDPAALTHICREQRHRRTENGENEATVISSWLAIFGYGAGWLGAIYETEAERDEDIEMVLRLTNGEAASGAISTTKPDSPAAKLGLDESLKALALLFPDSAGIAMDESGHVYAYLSKPDTDSGSWFGDESCLSPIAALEDHWPHEDWKDTWTPLPKGGAK